MLIRTYASRQASHPDKTRHPIMPVGPRSDGKKTPPEAHILHERKADETRKPALPEPRTTPVAVQDHKPAGAPKKTPPPESWPPDKISTSPP